MEWMETDTKTTINRKRRPAVPLPGPGLEADGGAENDSANGAENDSADGADDSDEIDDKYRNYLKAIKNDQRRNKQMKQISRSLGQLMKETRTKYEEVYFHYQKNDKQNKKARRYMKILRKRLSYEKERFKQCQSKLK